MHGPPCNGICNRGGTGTVDLVRDLAGRAGAGPQKTDNNNMFDRLQKFIQTMGTEEEQQQLMRDDPRVAAAALFYHVIDADGVSEASERDKLRQLLEQEYAVDAAELRQLMDAGKRAEDESVDFYSSTSVLKRSLDAEQRVNFIELMWEMVYADGVRNELEENIVWRVAELLGVSDRDRVLMRQRVAERVGASGDQD